MENCGIIWQSGTVRSYKPFWKPRGATTKFSSFLLRSELLQAWPQNQPILDYGWFCKGVELAQVYHQQRYTKMKRKKKKLNRVKVGVVRPYLNIIYNLFVANFISLNLSSANVLHENISSDIPHIY